MVEHFLAKEDVGGSNPLSRSKIICAAGLLGSSSLHFNFEELLNSIAIGMSGDVRTEIFLAWVAAQSQ